MPMTKKMLIQEGNSNFSEHLIFFHDHIMIASVMIMYFVSFWTVNSIKTKFFLVKNQENNTIEMFWTIFPIMILAFAAIPSMIILFISEEETNSGVNLKVLGNQWYWEYEMKSKNKFLKWQSYMKKSKMFRNLMTSNTLIIPFNTKISALISSYDVIHSWSIPSIGKKCDAVPGRINLMSINIKKPSILTGQCSEICGMNHSFMPIMVKTVSSSKFLNIISLKSSKHQPLKLKIS